MRKTQGCCTEKYLFASPSMSQISSNAKCIAWESKSARILLEEPVGPAPAVQPVGGVKLARRSGTIPSRFLAIIDSDRCARLPNSLARSALVRLMIASSL